MQFVKLVCGFGVCLWALALAACAHSVGGKSISDAFPDTQTHQLAGAACRGDGQEIERLVSAGVDINKPGLDDVSVLMWALTCKNVSGVKALLNNGADPNYTIEHNYNPVSIAASIEQNTELLKAVIEAGGNVNAVSGSHEATALMTAFKRGRDTDNWNNYYYLLDAGADVNQLTNKKQSIGLTAAVANRYCKIIELLDRGYTHDLSFLLRGAKKTPTLLDGFPGKACLAPAILKLEARIAELEKGAN